DLPGYKVMTFEKEKFVLVDSYCKSGEFLHSKSAGTTTIWHDNVPVWWMSYGGYYEKSAIPFLKQSLLLAYGIHEFVGGRGMLFHSDGSMIYINHPEINEFSFFRGREEVIDLSAGSLGEHVYWGMSLIHNW
ncbi:MAG: hypothetical protein AAB725_01735, partial [Patescibacteria group bacterium]